MGAKSAIEWTDATWNPVTGCTKVSPGCKYCYAERLAVHLQAMGNPRYRQGFALMLHTDQLTLPLRWRQPKRIFVNSMSDLFHEAVPEEFIRQAFDVMARAHWHIFQILTKRAERLAALAPRLAWPSNVWQGVSVENAHYTWRIRYLQHVPAAVRFLSVEPLLGPIEALPLEGIHWVSSDRTLWGAGDTPNEALFKQPLGARSSGHQTAVPAHVWVQKLRQGRAFLSPVRRDPCIHAAPVAS
jgi:protein gp37